jgi:hypothetical protein
MPVKVIGYSESSRILNSKIGDCPTWGNASDLIDTLCPGLRQARQAPEAPHAERKWTRRHSERLDRNQSEVLEAGVQVRASLPTPEHTASHAGRLGYQDLSGECQERVQHVGIF